MLIHSCVKVGKVPAFTQLCKSNVIEYTQININFQHKKRPVECLLFSLRWHITFQIGKYERKKLDMCWKVQFFAQAKFWSVYEFHLSKFYGECRDPFRSHKKARKTKIIWKFECKKKIFCPSLFFYSYLVCWCFFFCRGPGMLSLNFRNT